MNLCLGAITQITPRILPTLYRLVLNWSKIEKNISKLWLLIGSYIIWLEINKNIILI